MLCYQFTVARCHCSSPWGRGGKEHHGSLFILLAICQWREATPSVRSHFFFARQRGSTIRACTSIQITKYSHVQCTCVLHSGWDFISKHHHIRVRPLKHIYITTCVCVVNHIFCHYYNTAHTLFSAQPYRAIVIRSFSPFRTLSFACVRFFIFASNRRNFIKTHNDRRWKNTETIAIVPDQKGWTCQKKKRREIITELFGMRVVT